MSKDEERVAIQTAIDSLTRTTGFMPQGFYCRLVRPDFAACLPHFCFVPIFRRIFASFFPQALASKVCVHRSTASVNTRDLLLELGAVLLRLTCGERVHAVFVPSTCCISCQAHAAFRIKHVLYFVPST